MQKTFDMSTLVLDLSSWKPESYIFWQYYWSPGRFGYDAIVSNGRFYEYSAIRSTGFTTYTEPILKDGLTYKASPYAPKWFDYYQGILYDEIGGRFLGIEKNTWILKELAVATTTQPFDWGNMHASLRYMETGYNNYEYGLFEDWDTKKMTLCVFNFDTKPNIGVGKYPADNCPELEKAKYFAVGSLGPVFLYATDRDIYRYDYNGTNTGEKLYTLAQADEKITGMKIFKPCIHRFIPNHPYNNKVLILSTYNESKKEGKIMAKLKTNKAAKKRYSLTATGKIKRTKSNRRHLLANKTKRQKKSGKVQNAYASKTCENTIKKLLPYGG